MKKFWKIVFKLILILIILVGAGGAALGFYGYKAYRGIMDDFPLNKKVEFIKDDPDYVSRDDVSKYYLDAVIAVEDHRFYSHGAVDFLGIGRAVFSNIKKNELREGGSTLTQQVAKNMYLMNGDGPNDIKTKVRRKLSEVYIAKDLFNTYSRDEILEFYINIIYFGDNHYGIKEACNAYLGKDPKDMNLYEAAMMAGIPNAPSVYAPTVNKDLCKSRQQKVINSMLEYGYITEEEAKNNNQEFIDKIN